jgi:hypothetical protein
LPSASELNRLCHSVAYTSAQLQEQAREGHISKSRNSGAGSPDDTMMRQAAETFDWGAIEALMR